MESSQAGSLNTLWSKKRQPRAGLGDNRLGRSARAISLDFPLPGLTFELCYFFEENKAHIHTNNLERFANGTKSME